MSISKTLYISALGLFSTYFLLTGRGTGTPQNHRPEVRITRPADKSTHPWNSMVRYRIEVSDQEDGTTKYQEISSDEVFLKVAYVPDTSGRALDSIRIAGPDPEGLANIKSSNCFNCHAFKSKLLGPSFSTISKHYDDTDSVRASLEKHILEGSSGVWGQASMPSHPELSEQKVQHIVDWIMERAADPNVDFYKGAEGSFRMRKDPGSASRGAYLLQATYTDHGSKNHPGQVLEGRDTVIIYGSK